ncbi:MAG: signal peptidase II [Candidatus Margulisbacteria bacterium]|nr:signal peptidase II [Candidatus Margulisiibacteriota bacterium]
MSLFIAFSCFALDQLSKWVARSALVNGSVDLGWFRFDLVFNTGAAYGMFSNATSVLLWVGVAVIGYLLFTLSSLLKTQLDAWLYGFILGGAMGNTFDRLWFGNVTDFVNIHIIPVFNLADVWLNCGFCLMLVQVILYGRKKPTHMV